MAKGEKAIDQIGQILEEYGQSISEELKTATGSVIKEGAKKLKSVSPRRTGDYAKSWKSKMQDGGSGAIHVVHGTIYADAPHYRLTHLLENGHAKRGGGRVAARPHIGAVNDWAQTEVIKRLKDEIGGGLG